MAYWRNGQNLLNMDWEDDSYPYNPQSPVTPATPVRYMKQNSKKKIFHSNLSKDLSSILNNTDDFDVTIKVGEGQNTKECFAHSVILRARSPYFKSALSSGWAEKKDDMITFDKPNIIPEVFEMILKYIYAGEIDLTDYQDEHILDLLIASDELLIEELFEYIQDYLIDNLSIWIQQNFILVINTAFKLGKCKRLQDYCIESICTEAQLFIDSKDFPSLDKNILYELLKRDDLRIEEEVEAWNCLIKWGIKQTPGLEDVNKNQWNDENYEALKNTLEQFIPLIRFTRITREDYFDKIRPYKSILPKNIYEEIEEFYFKGTSPEITTSSPRIGIIKKIDSDIIKPKLLNIIISWIKANEPNKVFKFGLIYRKSRDGVDVMRDRCSKQVAMLILVKVKRSNKIFGGYNPIGWRSQDEFMDEWAQYRTRGRRHQQTGRYSQTEHSFIFSFENKEDIYNMKISRVIDPSNAIFSNDKNEINFGGSNLRLENDNLYLSSGDTGSYEGNLNSNGVFETEEIEAFYVIDESESYWRGRAVIQIDDIKSPSDSFDY